MREKAERFGISIPKKLLDRFDNYIKGRGYSNRSEAIRDLMREYLVAIEWEGSGEVVGSLTLVYDHEVRGVADKLTHLQHEYPGNIVSSMHIHLDERNCMELLVIRGSAKDVQKIADSLISSRGVKQGKLAASTIGKNIP